MKTTAKTAEDRLILRARRALEKISPEARSRLFREMSLCGCADLARAAVRNPAVAVGAVLGGLFGLVAPALAKRGSLSSTPGRSDQNGETK